MFYVGTYTTFRGHNSVLKIRVKDLDKLGHSRGRAVRYLNEHKPKTILEHRPDEKGQPKLEEVSYRAVVFVMPERFRLSNDVIKLAMKQHKCNWDEAKFHVYRVSCIDIMGNREDWPELFPKETDTAEPPQEVSQGNEPVTEGAAEFSSVK